MADSMKLVPVEPTEAMLTAAWDSMPQGSVDFDTRSVWSSMLAASPPAPAREIERIIYDAFGLGSENDAADDAVRRVEAYISALTAREEAPAEGAGELGDALLALLFRHGLKVALDLSEIEEIRASALRDRTSEPEARMTVIEPDQWEPCSPSWIERHPTGCGQAPRVWCEAESNHYHPVNWKGS